MCYTLAEGVTANLGQMSPSPTFVCICGFLLFFLDMSISKILWISASLPIQVERMIDLFYFEQLKKTEDDVFTKIVDGEVCRKSRLIRTIG